MKFSDVLEVLLNFQDYFGIFEDEPQVMKPSNHRSSFKFSFFFILKIFKRCERNLIDNEMETWFFLQVKSARVERND
jgi:hypothetical protein